MKIIPHIKFSGNCKEALDFYKSCFNGQIIELKTFAEAKGMFDYPNYIHDKIMHSEFRADEIKFYACDGMLIQNHDEEKCSSNSKNKCNSQQSFIEFGLDPNSKEEQKNIFEKLSEGGKIIMPLEKTFWNAIYGEVVDKFDIKWCLNLDI